MSHGAPDPDDIRDNYRGKIAKDTEDAAGDTYIQGFIDRADRMKDDLYSGRIRTEGEVEGDVDDFVLYLALHMIQLAEGGEVQSDSQTGGSVNYNVRSGEPGVSLAETRYGRMAREYLRQETSIGVELSSGVYF